MSIQPTTEDVQLIAWKIARRVHRLLDRRGLLEDGLCPDEQEHPFHYAPDTKGDRFKAFLKLGEAADGTGVYWRGAITADALSSHNRLFTELDCIESGCNAHGLRKFRDEKDKAPLLASDAMHFIGRWFSLEAKAREKGLVGSALFAYRQQHSQPVAVPFRAWLEEHREDLLPSHPVRKAMQYYINHWTTLTQFLRDPDVGLENNASERALRKVALFRNNSMYVSGEEGAVDLCVALSVIPTCRLIGVDPFAYLVWVLPKLVTHPDNRGRRVVDLLPAAYKEAQQRDAGKR